MKITTYTKKDGSTVYRTSIYLGIDQITGRKIKTTVSARTKRELQQKAREKERDFIAKGSTTHQKAVKVSTYAELVTLWQETNYPTFKPNTIRRYNMEIKRYLLPAFGAIKLSQLNRSYIQKVVNDWARAYNTQLSGGYKLYNELHSLNKTILAFGVALDAVPSNPCHDIIVPKRKPTPDVKKHFDNKELSNLLDYLDKLPPTYQNTYKSTLYKFLLATGCRIGEALALEWSDIDLDVGTVSISKNLQEQGTVSTTKTRQGNRTISIDRKTALMLRLYKARQAKKLKEMGNQGIQVVFSTCLVPYPDVNRARERLKKDLEQLGIHGRSFHAFRHTHASLLLNAGIPYKDLSNRLGHANIAVTMDTYSHLSPDKEKEAVTYFEKSLSVLKSS
ncbi:MULTISPECIES: tyrosine-type recombinase/integrase [unclassified Streptococcus]|uniref:tyrosine-type recombinase/integrase n=1 Tax=unclassified Streptococcus TaxID=2608887 RepID=UPI00359CEB8C